MRVSKTTGSDPRAFLRRGGWTSEDADGCCQASPGRELNQVARRRPHSDETGPAGRGKSRRMLDRDEAEVHHNRIHLDC